MVVEQIILQVIEIVVIYHLSQVGVEVLVMKVIQIQKKIINLQKVMVVMVIMKQVME